MDPADQVRGVGSATSGDGQIMISAVQDAASALGLSGPMLFWQYVFVHESFRSFH